MKKNWWKILSVVLLLYTLLAGLLVDVPRLSILNETIRNLHFHVTMWFAMIILLSGSVVFSVKHLRTGKMDYDDKAVELAKVGILFSVLGMLTGMLWAQYAWGAWWSGDAKQNTTAICMLIYFAYLVLRNSMTDEQQRGRVSAVYNVFAYAAMVPLLFVLPRMYDSLHPGNGGNPGLNFFDLDGKLRMVFYPAIIGWALLGLWLAELRLRSRRISRTIEEV